MKKNKTTRYNDSKMSEESSTDASQEYRGRKRFKKDEHLSEFSEMQTGMKNRLPESDKNSDITESVVYYERILKDLKKCLNDDSKELFSQNVLQESENKEVELCCHKVSSHCIEVLLPLCKDEDILQRFMVAFSENKETVCTDPSASHITELLIKYCLQNVKNWNPDFIFDDGNQESKLIMNSISWLTDFADFVHENFSSCLTNVYSCHVANTLIRALSGDLTQQRTFMSKSSQAHKRQFYESYVDEDNVERVQCNDDVILEHVPKFFFKSLKRLAKALMAMTDIEDYITDSSVATVIEALLVAVKKRLPKRCKKLILCIAEKIFQQKNQDGIPFALLHKNSSYIIEEMFKAADDEVQHLLWQQYMEHFLSKLVVHPIGNYIVQRLFDTATNVQHFETVCQSAWNLFDEILNCRHYGIFVSIANACVRLKVQQAQFMKSIMQCLHCLESEERHLLLIPLLLGFKKYEQYIESKSSQGISICLQGSLVSRAVLKFHKPIKVVNSLLNMKPQELVFLACHIQGCHVLNSYFAASNNVGMKNKDKLLNHLKPAFVSLICDRNGSLTLSRIWTLLSIKQKEIIMKDIVMNEKELQQDRNGSVILKKFGAFYFKTHFDEWIQMQNNLTRKNQRKTF